MAIVQGIRERVHLPLYDSVTVEPGKQLRDAESSSTLKFFINVQNKTKLETNLQSASLLPHLNTFEARAMRVVLSDLPPVFSDEVKGEGEAEVVFGDGEETVGWDPTANGGAGGAVSPATSEASIIGADVSFSIERIVELIREARKPENEGFATIDVDDDDVELVNDAGDAIDAEVVADFGAEIFMSEGELRGMLDDLKDKRKIPLDPQITLDSGAAPIINKFVYNTVTSLYVGEKIMIQMPTWFFPAGAGTYSEQGKTTAHGLPSPSDTFRFAEPIFIDRQQNFRVEIEIPDADTLKDVQRIYGPLFVWVVLDGYMTRGVQ
jgi:hypothetical protein